jgi:hypothetical protein
MMHPPHWPAQMESSPIGARTGRGLSLLRNVLPAACLALLALGCLANAALGGDETADSLPHIIFTKEFPNSQPDYYSISVYENGRATYRTAPGEDSPLEFQVPPETAGEIFSFAGKLNLFRDRNLETSKRVAFMGKKTLAYQKGAEHHEAAFNFTEVPEALALADLFEKISQTEQHLLRLKYLIRFDRLGVEKELLQLEIDLDAGRLLGAAQLSPLLEQIENNRSLVHVAQTRAAQILVKIRSGKF